MRCIDSRSGISSMCFVEAVLGKRGNIRNQLNNLRTCGKLIRASDSSLYIYILLVTITSPWQINIISRFKFSPQLVLVRRTVPDRFYR